MDKEPQPENDNDGSATPLPCETADSNAAATRNAPRNPITCPECGGMLVPESGCWHCIHCGYSKMRLIQSEFGGRRSKNVRL